MDRVYSQQVQVRPLGMKLHDRKAGQAALGPGRQHGRFRLTDGVGNPLRGPGPGQPGLDQIARHQRDASGVSPAGQFQLQAVVGRNASHTDSRSTCISRL